MSLEPGREATGRQTSFLLVLSREIEPVGMWKLSLVRFPRAVGAEEILLLVFLRVHGPPFPPPGFLHAILFGKVANSLALACCICSAAAGSLCAHALRSSSSMVPPGFR